MILGLDISTSTIGYTLLNYDGSVFNMGFVKPIGDTIFGKLNTATNELIEILLKNPPAKIYAEQPNIMFNRGFSSAQVISKLLRFNGGLLFTLSKQFNTFPNEIMASSARKKVIGIGRFKENPKEHVLQWVCQQPGIELVNWPEVSKGKKVGSLAPECYDMADSYIIARYGLLNEQLSRKS